MRLLVEVVFVTWEIICFFKLFVIQLIHCTLKNCVIYPQKPKVATAGVNSQEEALEVQY